MPAFDITIEQFIALFPEFADQGLPGLPVPHWGRVFGPVSGVEERDDEVVVWTRTGGAVDRPVAVKLRDQDLARRALDQLSVEVFANFLMQVRPIEAGSHEVEVVARHLEVHPDGPDPQIIPAIFVCGRVVDAHTRGPVEEIDLRYPVAAIGRPNKQESVVSRVTITPTLCCVNNGSIPVGRDVTLKLFVGPAGWSASDTCFLAIPRVCLGIPLPVRR